MKRLCTASVMERLDVSSKTTIRRYVKDGILPRPMQDSGSNINYWLESDLEDMLRRQAEKRDNKTEQQRAAA